ncbi:MAG: helix-turn-helix domain-containing protein [Pseudonocardiales bacterium]|nr:helix-turn-helix domain-containing protein [Pseudonocardiales bacterium]
MQTRLDPRPAMAACLAQWREAIVECDDTGLQDQVRETESVSRMLHSVMLETVAELGSRNIAASAGFGSTKRLLAGMLHLSATEAGTRVACRSDQGRVVVDVEDARTIGARLRLIRNSRRKSLRVVAGLAGISKSHLDRIERGETLLDRRSEIFALADALQVAPSELTRLPELPPANSDTDSAEDAVRLSLMAVNHDQPGGQVSAVQVLRARVMAMLDARCRCDRQAEAAAALPELIRDVHTSIAAGRDVAELLDLTVLLHTQGTAGWLRVVGAPLDLREQAVTLAQQVARNRDTPITRGIATQGSVNVMLTAGAVDLAQAALDSVTVPTSGPETTQLGGMLALSEFLVAAADKRTGDAQAALEYATELARRTGEGNAYWMGFGPINVELWRMAGALEIGDHEQAVATAESPRPQAHPNLSRQAVYWLDYGRALTRVRGRHDDAVLALRRAERISPVHLHRNPLARDALALLVTRSRRDAIGLELRGMAYRASLPV